MTDLTKPPTLTAILGMWTDEDAAEDDPLREADARQALVTHLGDRPAADVARMQVFQLQPLVVEALPGHSKPRALTKALLAYLKDMGFGGDTPPAAAPGGPIEVTVRQDKSLEQMDFNELFELLVGDPSRYQEVLPYLQATATWQQITAKTQEWVLPTADGQSVDVQQTSHYVRHLLTPHSNPQRQFNGRRPVTLAVALGVSVRPYAHPITGKPVVGLDELGFNLDELDEELHRAAIWARTSHPLFPRSQDLFDAMTELFSNPLSARWQQILDDFRHTVQVNEEVGRTVSRYWTEGTAPVTQPRPDDGPRAHLFGRPNPGDSPTDQRPPPPAEDDNAHYKRLISEVARGAHTIKGHGNTCTGGVYLTLNATGNNITFVDPIVLEGGSLDGHNFGGTILVPPGVTIDQKGNNHQVEVVVRPWRQLAERAGVL